MRKSKYTLHPTPMNKELITRHYKH